MVEVTEDFDSQNTQNGTTNGFNQKVKVIEATEGLRTKLQNCRITEDPKVEINMVELNGRTTMDMNE